MAATGPVEIRRDVSDQRGRVAVACLPDLRGMTRFDMHLAEAIARLGVVPATFEPDFSGLEILIPSHPRGDGDILINIPQVARECSKSSGGRNPQPSDQRRFFVSFPSSRRTS